MKTLMKIKLEIMRAVTSPLSPGLEAEGTYETSIRTTGYTVTSKKSVILTLITLRVAEFQAPSRCSCGLLSSR